MDFLNKAAKDKASIITLIDDSKYIEKIDNYCFSNQYEHKKIEKLSIDNYDNFLHDINVLVIYCIGETDDNQQIDVQLQIHKEFAKHGYNVVSYSYNDNTNLFGFVNISSIINNEDKKTLIFKYNYLLWQTSRKKDTDLIIVSIPGGIMPYSNKLVGNFGLISYYMALEATPDYAVYNACYGEYKKEFFIEFNNIFKYRFGYEVDSWFMTNRLFDKLESVEHLNIVLRNVMKETYKSKIEEYSRKGFEFKTIQTIANDARYSLVEDNVVEFV